MEQNPRPNPPGPPTRNAPPANSSWKVLMTVLLSSAVIFVVWTLLVGNSGSRTITYDKFRRELKKSNVEEIEFVGQLEIVGKVRTIPPDLFEDDKRRSFFGLSTTKSEGAKPEAEAKPEAGISPAAKSEPVGKAAESKGSDSSTPEGKADDAKATPESKTTDAKLAEVKTSDAKTSDVALKPAEKKPSDSERSFRVYLPTVIRGDDLDRDMLAIPANGTPVKIKGYVMSDNGSFYVITSILIPILFLIGIIYLMTRMRDQVMGGGMLSGFTRSNAKRYDTSTKPVTFADVAGLEGVKSDLQEVVEFLKNPQKFARLGGRIPKGILLFGPPGTGKTLLARAVAGEAGVPFFSINGSEFIQMFVGVGASRVRDLFRTAKEASPAILFIDEIDAVGRHRGAGLGGGNDEREQTLNQILSEMDGFSQTESVIVVAATNRPDVLDPALLRPGRFDRHITVDRPNIRARVAMFKVHCRDVPLAPSVDLERLAAGTVGLTGADIRNLVNEAALWATRNGKSVVDMDDFEYARDKVLMGPKREEILSAKVKTETAYHEAGHALLAWMLPGSDFVHKVTIVPRGRALGVTQLLPEEDRMSIAQGELHNKLVFIMGGRAAEKVVFNEFSAGAENDLKQATSIARRMVAHWGMSERIGPVACRASEEHPFLGKEIVEQREYSEHTAQMIDEEISRILNEADSRARQMLTAHRDKLDLLAKELEKREVLDDIEIAELIGPSVNVRASMSDRNGAETKETKEATKREA